MAVHSGDVHSRDNLRNSMPRVVPVEVVSRTVDK